MDASFIHLHDIYTKYTITIIIIFSLSDFSSHAVMYHSMLSRLEEFLYCIPCAIKKLVVETGDSSMQDSSTL